MPKLTRRFIDTLQPRAVADRFEWDDELPGFGIRMKKSGSACFIIQYKIRGQTRRLKITGLNTAPEQARRKAKLLLAQVEAGGDPSQDRHDERAAKTVKQVCAEYMIAARAGSVTTKARRPKRASTIDNDAGRIERHITPLIGNRIMSTLTLADCQRLYDQIAVGKTSGNFRTGKLRRVAKVTGGHSTARRTIGFLGGVWTWAKRRGLVTGVSPVHGIESQRGEAGDRTLSLEELQRLGATLRLQQTVQPMAVNAVRLLALSGLRKQEAIALRWSEVDAATGCLRLTTTKTTGRQLRPIGTAALRVLAAIPHHESGYVFPNRAGNGSADLVQRIGKLFNAAGLPDVTAHDLRRTYATIAAETYGDGTVGELLGHARIGVTAQHYIRRPDDVLVGAANKVSEQIAAMMDGKIASVSPLHKRDKSGIEAKL
jgi:integrase